MELITAYHIGPEWSAFLVWVCCLLPLLGLIGFAARRIAVNLRLARDAERESPATNLRPGPAVIAGKVVRGRGKAIRVEIDQKGTQHKSKNSYSHRWSETARRVTVDPFEVELSSGGPVTVVADDRVFLVDQLDAGQRTSRHDRTRVAELSDGEQVYVVGTIEEGDPDPRVMSGNYREPPARKLVMRAPRGGRLLIASEPLGRRFRSRVWFHARWIGYTVVAIALVHGGTFLGYHLRLTRGKVVSAQVTRLHNYTVRGRKSSTTYHMVHATRDDDGGAVAIDARKSSYYALTNSAHIDLLVVDGWPKVTSLGSRATVSWQRALWMMFAIPLFFGLYIGNRESTRPWYEQKRIVDHGSGKLPPF